MINLDVPQHIIQRYLGHKTPEMTNHYARIHDKTLRAKLEDFLGKRIVDIRGEAIEQRGTAEWVLCYSACRRTLSASECLSYLLALPYRCQLP